MDKEVYEKLEAYYEKFGDVFPTMEYGLNDRDVIKFIDKCFKKNKSAKEIQPLLDDVKY